MLTRYFTATLFAISFTSICFGQHSDIEFGLDDLAMPGAILIENDLVNTDGLQVAEGEFDFLTLGGVSDFFADNPGFITAADEGFLFNQGDSVSIRFLNAATTPGTSIGAGYVNFFDPTNAAAGLQASGAIEISNQSGGSSTFDGAVVSSGSESIFLALGDDGTGSSDPPPSTGEDSEDLEVGEIHTHLVFDLLNDNPAPAGLYGLLAEFEADLDAVDGTIDVTSAPFWLVFNHQLSEDDFEAGLSAFNVVPEPSAGILMTAMAGAILTRRRRRRLDGHSTS